MIFDDYIGMKKALHFEEMSLIHKELLSEVESVPGADEIYKRYLEKAFRYAGIRAGWTLLSREEKMDQDPGRTSAHDSLIAHTNMLSRYLKQNGKEAAWRNILGYIEDDPYNRKRIGDFAVYVSFVEGLLNR